MLSCNSPYFEPFHYSPNKPAVAEYHENLNISRRHPSLCFHLNECHSQLFSREAASCENAFNFVKYFRGNSLKMLIMSNFITYCNNNDIIKNLFPERSSSQKQFTFINRHLRDSNFFQTSHYYSNLQAPARASAAAGLRRIDAIFSPFTATAQRRARHDHPDSVNRFI